MENDKIDHVNREQALSHLLKKQKYDVLMALWEKVIPLLGKNCDKVTFIVGKDQKSYPSTLVKPFSNIRNNSVRVFDSKYSIKEIETLMDILTRLPTFQCSGVFTDYKDWTSISSFVNLKELAEMFEMKEVRLFLDNLQNLLTEYNKNAIAVEVQRRKTGKSDKNTKPGNGDSTKQQSVPEKRARSRSRRRSISEIVKRSLSRGRRHNDDKN